MRGAFIRPPVVPGPPPPPPLYEYLDNLAGPLKPSQWFKLDSLGATVPTGSQGVPNFINLGTAVNDAWISDTGTYPNIPTVAPGLHSESTHALNVSLAANGSTTPARFVAEATTSYDQNDLSFFFIARVTSTRFMGSGVTPQFNTIYHRGARSVSTAEGLWIRIRGEPDTGNQYFSLSGKTTGGAFLPRTDILIPTAQKLLINNTYRLIVTWERTGGLGFGRLWLYVAGVAVGPVDVPSPLQVISGANTGHAAWGFVINAGNLESSRDATTAYYKFDGQLDCLTMFPRILTAQEIIDLNEAT